MKRPGHGLLKRMLRLMEVDLEYATIQDRSMKVLSLQYGAEYHIGLQILKSPLFNSSTECAAEWLSISMPGCLPLRFQVRCLDVPRTIDIIISYPSWTYKSGDEHAPMPEVTIAAGCQRTGSRLLDRWLRLAPDKCFGWPGAPRLRLQHLPGHGTDPGAWTLPDTSTEPRVTQRPWKYNLCEMVRQRYPQVKLAPEAILKINRMSGLQLSCGAS